MLLISFVGTSYIKAYDETEREVAATSRPDVASKVFGFESSDGIATMLLCFLVAMLALLTCTLIQQIRVAVLAPTIRLVSTRREPQLSLPARCTFHGFISHGMRADLLHP